MRHGRPGLAVAAVAGFLALAGCGASIPSSVASAQPPSAAPTAAPASPTAGPLAAASGGDQVALDPALLTILPATVDGVAVTSEPDSYAQAAKDPSFVASVDRAVFAIAVKDTDLASGVVAHLRPGVWSDAFFQDWRDTYDLGACGQAGGVVGHAQGPVAGRTVFVTTCGGGLRVLHAWLAGPGVVVSLFSTGAGGFGDLIMAGLRG